MAITIMSKRLLITMPKKTKQNLRDFAALNHVDSSVIVQQAITEMSNRMPTQADLDDLPNGPSERMLVTFSYTGIRLLEMWSEKTGITKSNLVAYALEKCIKSKTENGGEE